MAKVIEQYRYKTGESVSNTSFSNINLEELAKGQKFKYPITQLGIVGNEGVEFYLNNSYNTIRLGPSQVFELEDTSIISLKFVPASINAHMPEGSTLLIDCICEV